jgi:hypothetical protein
MTTFWQTATTEQKLAQIDGGIECGLNAKQVGMNCGTDHKRVLYFAINHGRHFLANNFSAGSLERFARRGQVEAVKRISARTGTIGDSAFSLFDHQPQPFELE